MGRYIKVPNISFSLNNLGQATLKNTINDNIGLGKTIVIPNVSFASNNLGKVHIPNEHYFEYFTIESLEDNNTITAVKTSSGKNPIIYYSFNEGETWDSQTLSSGTITFGTINTGEKIIFKCTISNWATDWNKYNRFNGSKKFKVYGNIMSLLNGDNFISNSKFDSKSSFNLTGLFYGTTTIIDASDLILPALTLTTSCYNGMFRGATNLVNGPKVLPALDVSHDGYSSMFEGCVKLVEGPEICATTISGDTALNRMFCMSRNSKVTAAMTKSPILRIINPSEYSNTYQQLFCGNENINEITILAEGTNLSFNNWLSYNGGSGVIKKLSTMTLTTGSSGVPSGWTTQTYEEK